MSCRPGEGRGRRPRLSDAELLTLAVAQVLLGFDGEHRWIRFAYCRLGHLFRYLPTAARLQQAADRGRAVAGHGDHPPGHGQPVVVRRPAPDRRHPGPLRHLPGDGGALGPGRARRLRLLRLALPVLLGLQAVPARRPRRDADRVVPGRPEDRRTRGVPGPARPSPSETGQAGVPVSTVLADKGLAGREIEGQIAQLGSQRCCARTGATNAPVTATSAESGSGSKRSSTRLKGQLGLERHGGRTSQGVGTRVAQRLLALAAAVWHNWITDAPNKRSLTAYDH